VILPFAALLKAPRLVSALETKYDKPLSNLAFNFDWCRYMEAIAKKVGVKWEDFTKTDNSCAAAPRQRLAGGLLRTTYRPTLNRR